MERMPLAPSSWRVGRFSDGLASLPLSVSAKRIGSFADGLVLRPDAYSTRRVGSFGDGLEREGGDSRSDYTAEPRPKAQRLAAEHQASCGEDGSVCVLG